MKDQEINFVYNAVLNKERLLNHLDKFREELNRLEKGLVSNDIGSGLPKDTNRKKILEQFTGEGNSFKKLCDDYQQIKDFYSLEKIKGYISLALSENMNPSNSQLVIERALQVTGEYLKNTVESPHMSENLSDLLLANFHKKAKEIITELRDRLSHAVITLHTHEKEYIFGQRTKIKKNEKFLDDLKKLNSAINVIIEDKKVELVRTILDKISKSKSLEEIKKLTSLFKNRQVVEIDLQGINTKEDDRVKELVKELKDIIEDLKGPVDKDIIKGSLDYEKYLEEIDAAVNLEEKKLLHTKALYIGGLVNLKGLISEINYSSDIKSIKNSAEYLFKTIDHEGGKLKPKNFEKIITLVAKLNDRVKHRLDSNNSDKMNRIIYGIFYNAELKSRKIEGIQELKKSLEIKFEEEHVQNEISRVFADISDGMGADYSLLKLEQKKEVYEKLENLLRDLNLGSVSYNLNEFEYLLDKLVKLNIVVPNKKADLIKLYENSNWQDLKRRLRHYPAVYHEFRTNIRNFIRDREFNKISSSIQKLCKDLTNDPKSKLKTVLDNISRGLTGELREHFNERLGKLKELSQDNEKDEVTRAVREMLVLDIIAYLEEKEGRLDTSTYGVASFLDRYTPTLIGKQLRNYLAHGNPLVEVLISDPLISVTSNDRELVKLNVDNLSSDVVIGQPVLDFQYLQDHYNEGLKFVTVQQEMFSAAEKDNVEKIKEYIRKGADVESRSIIDGWSGLHYAAKGNNVDTVKFFLEQKLS